MDVLVIGRNLHDKCENRRWDLVAVAPNAELSHAVDCCCLLLPEDASLPEGIKADWAVTYGLSGRSSLSAASLMGPGTVISVQREIRLPCGGFIDKQDIVLPHAEGDSMQLLWQAGLELMTGTLPEELGNFLC